MKAIERLSTIKRAIEVLDRLAQVSELTVNARTDIVEIGVLINNLALLAGDL